MTVGSWRENPMKRNHTEDMVVDGKIILKCFKVIGYNHVDCILLAVVKARWPVLVNAISIKMRRIS